jgi:hypothetical protein
MSMQSTSILSSNGKDLSEMCGSLLKSYIRNLNLNEGHGHPLVLYIKANMVSVCLCGQKLGSAWKILPVTARSLWSWWQTGQGRAARAAAVGGPRKVPFLLKKSLGKTGGPASNQTKIQFF